ncbi:hypothetical protein RchiOBHm_Chr1g0357931 [Rosa chinensis]|uniref:Uncharacterized protein n=1 Tax=Rosa chinensis TaxID=74649 RepID=A0A2P6SI11_ROSCH|nr:hypothetical protein RchiOBHm_Chr1g0357931 [Rosa chinensis]
MDGRRFYIHDVNGIDGRCVIQLLEGVVERCMVQVGDIGVSGKIKTCRLHDLMRDLCLLKAEEENFIHIVNLSGDMRIKQVAPIGKVRRLAIYLEGDRVNILALTRDGHLRSLLYFSPNLLGGVCKKDLQTL